MDRKNGKRLLTTALSASVLLLVACVIVLILAIVQKWDVIGWMTSQTAFLVYAVLGVAIVSSVSTLVLYFAVWRYK